MDFFQGINNDDLTGEAAMGQGGQTEIGGYLQGLRTHKLWRIRSSQDWSVVLTLGGTQDCEGRE